MPGNQRPPRRGTTFLGAAAVAVLFLLVAGLLAACSDHGSAATERKVADPGTADCAAGGQAVAGLRDTFRALSDQLNGLGPAAQRNDLADMKSRVSQGIRLSDQVTATIHPAVDRMGSPSSAAPIAMSPPQAADCVPRWPSSPRRWTPIGRPNRPPMP
ncbi:hypothetical protein [Nocardia brasiliensis]|uniref:hypothetical protein n=1 Tax=Nocardia brasiliensis TaxID=37326 RepID=UPI003D8C1AB5